VVGDIVIVVATNKRSNNIPGDKQGTPTLGIYSIRSSCVSLAALPTSIYSSYFVPTVRVDVSPLPKLFTNCVLVYITLLPTALRIFLRQPLVPFP